MVIYFILPFILKLLKKNKKVLRLLVVVSCLLSLVATTIIYIVNSEFTGNNSFTFYSFITQLPAVLIGVAVYYNREKLLSAKIALGILLFIAATGITFLLFFIGNEILTSLVPFFAAISFVGLYIVVCRIKDNKLFSLLAKIGDISFSAYLIHFVFAWYLPAIIKNIVNVSDNILFIILLLPCFCLSICFAGAINILLNKISGKLKKILL